MRLPTHLGKHPVGFAAFTLPVANPRSIGNSRLADGSPALRLQETSFNIFYPAEPAKKKRSGVHWMPRPSNAFSRGYAIFMEVAHWVVFTLVYVWASFIRMPVYANAKLGCPKNEPLAQAAKADGESKWPVVIFSHGLGGTRTAYSQFCGNLASEGYIVIALEHRDLSGPMFLLSGKEHPYVKIPQWEDGKEPSDPMAWRVEQLAFRRVEVYETFQAFAKAIDSGKPGAIQIADFDWTCWKDQVECGQNVILAGHSFGSATVMSILSQPPPEGFLPLPAAQVILLDPWVEPFGSSGPLSLPDCRPALCIIASESFTVWDSHFERLHGIVKGWRHAGATAHLTTILRSRHQDFSDFAVLLPGARRAIEVIKGTHETVMKFIRGSLDDTLRGKGAVMEIEQIKKNKRQIKGEPGELFVHE